MSTEITIHGYPNGGIKGQRPRVPMIHIMASDGYGDVHSITFHPDRAGVIAAAIMDAARSAKTGRKRKPVKITISETIGQ